MSQADASPAGKKTKTFGVLGAFEELKFAGKLVVFAIFSGLVLPTLFSD